MICKYCSKNESIDGLKYCIDCKTWHRKYSRERNERLKSEGICVSCGSRKSVDGTVHCDVCNEKNRKRARVKSKYARDNNLCYRCKKNKCTTGTICDDCKPIVRKNARESQRRLNAERMSRGVCVDCEKPTTDPSSVGRCLECHCYQTSNQLKSRSGERVDPSLLIDLWNLQMGYCALTGRKMLLSEAEVDHIVPMNDNGPTRNGNLRWVLKSANRAKWKMSEEEFINLCSDVVKHYEVTHG